MAHLRDQQEEEDSGASEADLLCSEVLSESHDEGSEAGSEEMYARRYYRASKVRHFHYYPHKAVCYSSVNSFHTPSSSNSLSDKSQTRS